MINVKLRIKGCIFCTKNLSRKRTEPVEIKKSMKSTWEFSFIVLSMCIDSKIERFLRTNLVFGHTKKKHKIYNKKDVCCSPHCLNGLGLYTFAETLTSMVPQRRGTTE